MSLQERRAHCCSAVKLTRRCLLGNAQRCSFSSSLFIQQHLCLDLKVVLPLQPRSCKPQVDGLLLGFYLRRKTEHSRKVEEGKQKVRAERWRLRRRCGNLTIKQREGEADNWRREEKRGKKVGGRGPVTSLDMWRGLHHSEAYVCLCGEWRGGCRYAVAFSSWLTLMLERGNHHCARESFKDAAD